MSIPIMPWQRRAVTSSKLGPARTIAMNTKVVYGAGDTAQAKLAASFGSPVPL
jgi:hypothetical protein